MIQALWLALLGISLGQAATLIAGPHTPQGSFNNVRCGVLGALTGGLLLPHVISGTIAYDGLDLESLLAGGVSAVALLAILAAWQRRVKRRG